MLPFLLMPNPRLSSIPRRILATFFLAGTILSACTAFPTVALEPTASPAPTASPTRTPTQPPTPTPTPTATQTPAPTATPTLPPIHPAAVNQLAVVAQAGAGAPGPVAVSPDGRTLAVAGSTGIWLYDKLSLEFIAALSGHAGPVASVSWSPAGDQLVSGGQDASVRVWDVSSVREGGASEQVHLLAAHQARVSAVSWSPDGRFIASASDDKTVWLWEISTLPDGTQDVRAARQLFHATGVYALAWHPGSRYFAVGSLDGTLDLWEAPNGEHLLTLEGHGSWVNALVWNPEGSVLASAGADKTIRLWDITFRPPASAAGKSSAAAAPRAAFQTLYNANALAWTPNGAQLASAGGSPFTIDFWNAEPGPADQIELRKAEISFIGHFAGVNGLAFAPGGVLVSTSADSTLRLWEARSGRELRRLSPEQAPASAPLFTSSVETLSWSPTGDRLASGHTDYTIRIWEAPGGAITQTHILTGHQNIIASLDWAANGRFIASGSYDNTTRIWDAATGELVQTVRSEGGRVNAVAFSPFGNQVAAGGLLNIVQVWEAGTDQPPLLLYPDTEITRLEWSPSGSLLAVGGRDGAVSIWDVPAGAAFVVLPDEHRNAISGLAWSPDGAELASLDANGKVVVWDVASASVVFTVSSAGVQQAGLGWSPDGALLAVGNGKLVHLVETLEGRPIRLLAGHTGDVRALEWKPGGGQLATAGADGTIRLWSVQTGEPAPIAFTPADDLPGPSRPPAAPITPANAAALEQIAQLGHGVALHVAAHPEGRYVAVAGGAGTWVYHAATWTPVRLLAGEKAYAAAWSPDGTMLAVRQLTSVVVWNVINGQALRVFGAELGVRPHLAWAPDSRLLAVGSFQGTVRVFNIATGEAVREWTTGEEVAALAWSPDGRTVAAGGGTEAGREGAGTVWLWDVPSGRPLNALTAHTGPVTHLAWSPDGATLLSAGEDLAITMIDVSAMGPPPDPREGESFPPLPSQRITAAELTGVVGLSWKVDGSQFLTADAGGQILLWGAESGQVQAAFSASNAGLTAAVWMPEGTLITLRRDGKLTAWDAASGAEISSFNLHQAEVRALAFSPWDGWLASGNADGTLRFWQLDGLDWRSYPQFDAITDLAFSASQNLVAVRTQDGAVSFWFVESESSQIIAEARGEPSLDWRLAFSPDGGTLVWNTAGGRGGTQIDGLSLTGDGEFRPFNLEEAIMDLAWSSDGSKLAIGAADGTVIIWDTGRGRQIRTIRAFNGALHALTWSADGLLLAVGGSDGRAEPEAWSVRVYEAATGRRAEEISLAFRQEASALAFSPDGLLLAVGDSFGDVQVWNLSGETETLAAVLKGHSQAITALVWPADGLRLVSGSRDGTIRVWGVGGD